MRGLILLLALATLSVSIQAEEFSARVIAVLDGDTVLVVRDGQRIKLRLAMIDAPEKDQEYGLESKRVLALWVLRKQVQVTTQALDEYGRTVALLQVAGVNVNEEQVRQGMAWNYSRFFSDPRYRALQVEAQQARRGLWQQDRPTPPWRWRKAHLSDSAALRQ